MTTRVTGPIQGGARGWPFAATTMDLGALDYVEAEYFLEGTAIRYRDVDSSLADPTGRWQAAAAGEAPFRTRMLVYRPRDPAAFNGTVLLTWNNVTAGYDLFNSDSRELFEGGYGLAFLTTQKVGIEGLPPKPQGLRAWDPERYGTLGIAGDDYAYDIFTQAARALRGEASTGDQIMAGLNVRRIVAQGASQSAGRLATYVNAIQPLTRALDGFLLLIYFGRGTPLEVGDAVVNINENRDPDPASRLRGESRLRDDLDVPVFVVNSELEAISCHPVRQPDTDRFRYWEAAGTCHVSRQVQINRSRMAERDGLLTRPLREQMNAVPMSTLYDAAFHHMHRWLTEGTPPPSQPLIEFAGSPAQIVRDEDGIARGGIRMPQVEAPLAKHGAIPLADDIFALLDGSSVPFTHDRIRALYTDHGAYMDRFTSAARSAVSAGVLLPRDAEQLIAAAAAEWPLD